MTDKRWDGLTITRELPIGVYYAGKRHRRVTLRVGMAGDLIEAQVANPTGTVRLIALDLFRRQLLALGDIPPEAITLDLMRQELTEPDLAELEKIDSDLGKQLSLARSASSTGDASSTPLSATATASTNSDA